MDLFSFTLYCMIFMVAAILSLWFCIPWISSDIKFLSTMHKMIGSNENLKKEMVTYSERLLQLASKCPEKTFVVYLDEEWTYKDVNHMVNKLSRVLMSFEVNKNDKVAVLMYNEPMNVAMMLACMRIGAKLALLNHKLRAQPLTHCILVVKPKLIIVGKDNALVEALEDIRDVLKDLNITVCTFSSSANDMIPILPRLDRSSPDNLRSEEKGKVAWNDTAVYIFTSGTTGTPKAVEVSHQKLLNVTGIGIFAGITSEDVIYCPLPLYHTAGLVAGILTTLRYGATVALRQRFSSSHFLDDCRLYKVTVIQYIGETMRYLCNQPVRADDYDHNIRLAYGNGLRPDVWKTFLRRFGPDIRVVELYASTEGNAAFINMSNYPGYVGRCTPLTKALTGQAFIKYDWEKQQPYRDRRGRCIEVKVNEPGLLIAKITRLTQHQKYAGPEELTNAKILTDVFKEGDRYYNSGDLLLRNQDYWVTFVDRIGDTFRWKGENVSTIEVSDILSQYPGIDEANTYGVKIPGSDGRAGMAAIVVKENTELDVGDLYSYVSNNLPNYAAPLFIRITETMDVTGTMKIRKSRVQEEGYDRRKCGDDPLYFCDRHRKAYVPLTSDIVRRIESGTIKL